MQRETLKLTMRLPDCQRLHDVIASTLVDANVGTSQAALFFAVAGSFLISHVHKLCARPVAGVAFYRVGDGGGSTLALGKVNGKDHRDSSDDFAFHCWIECEGTVIDLQAPFVQTSLPSTGRLEFARRKVFQRPLAQMSHSPGDLQRDGDFFLQRDPALSIKLMEGFMIGPENVERVKDCLHRYLSQARAMRQIIPAEGDAVRARDLRLEPIGLERT